MQRQRRRDTRPELAVRQGLHSKGLRYRVGYPVPGLPRRSIDVAFPRARLAVQVLGCFWHGCPQHMTWPQANAQWWHDKIQANIARDTETRTHLEELGWRVVWVWEHESSHEAVDRIVQEYQRHA